MTCLSSCFGISFINSKSNGLSVVESGVPTLKMSGVVSNVPSGYPLFATANLENFNGSIDYSLINSTCSGLSINSITGVISGVFGSEVGDNCTYQVRATANNQVYDSSLFSTNISTGFNATFDRSSVHLNKGDATQLVNLNLSSPAPFDSYLSYKIFSVNDSPNALTGLGSTGQFFVAAGATQVQIPLEFSSASSVNTNDVLTLRIENGPTQLLPSISINLSVSAPQTFSDLCSGQFHACGLSSGKLYCWGSNASNALGDPALIGTVKKPMQIENSTSWQSLTCGERHTCGINSGRLYCWGYDGGGQSGDGNGATNDIPSPLQIGGSVTWQQISAGNDHTCGINNGNLYCWGIGGVGQIGSGVNSTGYRIEAPLQIGVSSTWQKISAGENTSCGINLGRLFCWGYDFHGEQGNGPGQANAYVPTQVGALANWQEISVGKAGGATVCGIAGGNLYCWGSDVWGTAGNGAATSSNLDVPTRIGISSSWTKISVGFESTCGIDDGSVYCWGKNSSNLLGVQPHISDTSLPTKVGIDTTWSTVSVGSDFICGLNTGNVYCWGSPASHGTGRGEFSSRDTDIPGVIGNSPLWTDVAVNSSATCGIDAGRLYCWGANTYGQLGNGSTAIFNFFSAAPEQIGKSNNWHTLSSKGSHSCAIESGKLYCWGRNSVGQIGNGLQGAFVVYSIVPTRIGMLSNWSTVSAGAVNSCGIAAGALYCWGSDSAGQIGNGPGSTSNQTVPQQIGTSTSWTAVSLGQSHACGINNGQLYCWGSDSRGQLGNGAGIVGNIDVPTLVDVDSTWQKVSSGSDHTCGIKAGALYCWGVDLVGQIGNGIGSSADVLSPEQIGVSFGWQDITTNSSNTCGIDNGILLCWGSDSYGQIGNGSGSMSDIHDPAQIGLLTNWQKISTGNQTCGVESGKLYCWGSNQNYELGRFSSVSFPQIVFDF